MSHVPLVYSDGYRIDLQGLDTRRPFDVHKYQRIVERLIEDRLVDRRDLIDPGEAAEADLLRVHSSGYLEELKDPEYLARALEVELPAALSSARCDAGLLRPMRRATAGTQTAVLEALSHGLSINLGGGFHHAHPEMGHGFCLYADIGVALRALEAGGRLGRTLIIDLDAHHGDGNAAIFQDDAHVHILDFYEVDNFPYTKLPVWRAVELGRAVTDDEYLENLYHELPIALGSLEPELIVYLAGVDVYEGDPWTRFLLTREGILARDQHVIEQARSRGIPIAVVLGGGYAPEAWEIHHATVRWVLEQFGSW